MDNCNDKNASLTAKDLTIQYKQSGLFDIVKNSILEKDISTLQNNQSHFINISCFVEKQVCDIVAKAVYEDHSLISDDKRNKPETILNFENKESAINGKEIKNILQKLIVENTELQERIQDELEELYKSSLNI